MPLFEYKCDNCGKEFEILILDSKDTVECSHCNSLNITKLYSPFGLNSKNNNSSDIINQNISCGCNTGCGCSN